MASPSPAKFVGPVHLFLEFQGPAAAVDLFDGPTQLLAGVTPESALYSFDVTSDQHPGDGLHEYLAVVHAEDGTSVHARVDLKIDVPAGGTEDWEHVLEDGHGGYTDAAMLEEDVVVAGYEVVGGQNRVTVTRLSGVNGERLSASGPLPFKDPHSVTWSDDARGPALAVGADGAVYVAATRIVGTKRWRTVHKLRLDGPGVETVWSVPATGGPGEEANAIAVVGDTLVVAGSVRTSESPVAHDLRVWWLSTETGELVHAQTFAAPLTEGDVLNKHSERAYGVEIIGDQVVVVGAREVLVGDKRFMRTVVLRYTLAGVPVGEAWTSPGDVLAEDAALAITARSDGGFAVTGWARSAEDGAPRQVLSRVFAADGSPTWAPRLDATPGEDAVGRDIAEDPEGKLIVAASRERKLTSLDAWIFAAADAAGPRTWEVVRNAASNGPDLAAALVLDALGHVHTVGSEFIELELRAFALRLFP